MDDRDEWLPQNPEALYRQLMAQDPQSTLPRFSLAKLCVEGGRYPEAAELLQFCVSRQADWAVAWLLLGDALSLSGQLDPARQAYLRGRELALAQHHSSLAEEADSKLEGLD